MLKLIKYEFRKNRTVLLTIGGGTLLLQLLYLFQFFQKNPDKMAVTGIVLILWCSIFQSIVFILAVTNYARELNSRSSYLIFMTPNSSYSIIFSKMITTLVEGITLILLTVLLAWADVNLYSSVVPEASGFVALIRHMLESAGVPVDEILLSVLSGIATYLVLFFAIISLAYLAVTLCATFLQNSKAKYVISVFLFLLFLFVIEKITDLLPVLYDPPTTPLEALTGILPATAFHLVVLVLSIAASGWLLEKKVSL